MQYLIVLGVILMLPLFLVASDWRDWESPKPKTTWIPSTHPIAVATENEGFPPRAAALAPKEAERVVASKVAQAAAPVVQAPAVTYIEVPQYDRRGRFVGYSRVQQTSGDDASCAPGG